MIDVCVCSFFENRFLGTTALVCKGIPEGQPVSALTVCRVGQFGTRSVSGVQIRALVSSNLVCCWAPGPWGPRNTVLLRDLYDSFNIAHLLVIPESVVIVARTMCFTTELPELSHDERSVRCSVHQLNHLFKSVGILLGVTSLVLSHIWMEVVHDVFVVSRLFQLVVKVDSTYGIVGVVLGTGDDEDAVWCMLSYSFDHVGHAFELTGTF